MNNWHYILWLTYIINDKAETEENVWNEWSISLVTNTILKHLFFLLGNSNANLNNKWSLQLERYDAMSMLE